MTTALSFWKRVVDDRSDFLDRIISLLETHHIRYCVIGGAAVNAFVAPMITLDLDIVVADDDLLRFRAALDSDITVREFDYTTNLSAPESRLQVQIQKDERYEGFADRAERRDVLDLVLPVASLPDLVQAKVWAASDPGRRPTKRAKDLLDLSRLAEAYPEVLDWLPAELKERMAL